MHGEGPIAELMSQRFQAAKKRFGLDAKLPVLDLSQFKCGQVGRPGRPVRRLIYRVNTPTSSTCGDQRN